MVSGWPWLVFDGKATAVQCHDPLCVGAAPRTAVATTTHKILLAVAESATLAEMARLLASLGATRALNLDGGGSTSLIVEGRAVIGGTRRVPTQIGVVAKRSR